jgi:hypothetical protein
MRTYLNLPLLGLLSLALTPGTALASGSVCHGKPAHVMDAASESLVRQLSNRAMKLPEIGGCETVEPGSVLGFDHAGSTLYLVQANCIRKTGTKTHIHAVLECNAAKNRFSILGVSWGGSKGHGVAGGLSIAGQ